MAIIPILGRTAHITMELFKVSDFSKLIPLSRTALDHHPNHILGHYNHILGHERGTYAWKRTVHMVEWTHLQGWI